MLDRVREPVARADGRESAQRVRAQRAYSAHADRRLIVLLSPLWLACTLCACAASEADPDAFESSDEQAIPRLEPSASSPTASSPLVDSASPLQDRCLGFACAPLELPPQPKLAFLSHAGDGWLRLIEADWSLAPQSEGYRCVRKTVEQDVFITEFAPLNPAGTHHTSLIILSEPSAPDGVTVCNNGVLGERRVFGAGAGSSESTALPKGVAMKIAAGEQLLMNLHLFNPSDEVLRGRSGMHVKTVFQASVAHEAEVLLVGPLRLSIPPRQRVVQRGGCTLRTEKTLFSIAPHMHRYGVHAKVTARRPSEGDLVLYDGAYDFNHQEQFAIDSLVLSAGDRIDVECTYENSGDFTVGWGDSTLDEMCFAGVGLYPASGVSGLPCSN